MQSVVFCNNHCLPLDLYTVWTKHTTRTSLSIEGPLIRYTKIKTGMSLTNAGGPGLEKFALLPQMINKHNINTAHNIKAIELHIV